MQGFGIVKITLLFEQVTLVWLCFIPLVLLFILPQLKSLRWSNRWKCERNSCALEKKFD